MIPSEKKLLSGWSRYEWQASCVYRPESWKALSAVVRDEGVPDLLPRGLGRSYGDTALNGGGGIINLLRMNRFLDWNEEDGILTCEGGTTLKEILDVFLPRGWIPYVCPGTKYVTVGGSIANDVHGKNHHQDGSFCDHVLGFTLLTPQGEIIQCSREENSELFWATVGGIGLTGVIRTATFRLKRIRSAYVHGEYYQAKDLENLLEKMSEFDSKYPYTVAWLDCLAQKERMGRGILMGGRLAEVEELPVRFRCEPLRLRKKMDVMIPFDMPHWILSQRTVGIFNSWYYELSRAGYQIIPIEKFFFPLDWILDWNRLYGKKGFIQYQVVFPGNELRGLKVLLEHLVSSQRVSFLTVLKKMGKGNEGLLSFPMEGYTLALDIPNFSGLRNLVEDLNLITRRYGGRLYLAKDQLMTPDQLRDSYPNVEKFKTIKANIDPEFRFSSSMARRLELVPQRRRAPIC